MTVIYWKFGNFPENFIFTNSAKRHSCDQKFSRLEYDLPVSVVDSNFAISQAFYFHKTSQMQSFAKIKPSQNF